ncbi:carbonic anhydrase [Brevibacterium paucivorans]|uniref:carbonic anhydrase n=1 Tax=Brevibacterium paucivorans TaxID=170994 RepID=A0A2N6VPM0_9MICO|nr:carbonic anhydrase [Brevibacterium paucivorans]PMD05953.1 carbonic anhydrase [Brevibacterium paucivorans]
MPNSRAYATPQAAFDRLIDGNKRFVADTPEHAQQDSTRRRELRTIQLPYSTLFGCSDSRVAAELIFDVGLGEMFVVRTAGQVTDSVTIGSLEYGVEQLGTPLVIVLGHDSCGAVTASVDAYQNGTFPGGFVDDVVSNILPAVARAHSQGKNDIGSAVEQNTVDTVERLYARSYTIRKAVNEGRTALVGLTYALADGKVNVVAVRGDLNTDSKETQ